MLGAPVASARPSFFAVSDEGACAANRNVNTFLRTHHANVLRFVLAPELAPKGAGIGCVEHAYAAGYKVYISLQFKNNWSPKQVAAYIRRVLPTYAPYVWAIGVGNEQDLVLAGKYGQGNRSLSRGGKTAGQNYRKVWNAVEPVLANLVPSAIRVYGEFSPWDFAAIRDGFASGRPPGVQAIAAHCYNTKFGGLSEVPQDAAWAASKHLPLWCSEMGPALPKRTTPSWAVPNTWSTWNRLVAQIEARSPNLRMAGYYYYPTL